MTKSKPATPGKPYPEYPLFAHAVGQWSKKLKGKLWYFGVWADPDAALRKYLDEVDEIQAGRDPRRTGVVGVYVESISAYDVCNLYLERQQRRAESGEVTRRNFSDNLKACRRFMGHFGKFMKAASLSVSRLCSVQSHVPRYMGCGTNCKRNSTNSNGVQMGV